jgi:hypothetical protein
MQMRKWGLVLKVGAIVSALLVVKGILYIFDLEAIPVSTLSSAFVGGVIFTLAIVFAGTLTDYKESEKIPGELAASIKTLYKDCSLIVNEERIAADMRLHIKELLGTLNSNFRRNVWELSEVNTAMDNVNKDIQRLVEKGVAPVFIARFRTELSNVDKVSNRVETIAKTSFIPAAYAISELAIGLVLVVLLLTETDPYYEGLLIFGAIAFLLISMLLLVKDMDNPFEIGKNTYADVNADILFDLETRLESME